MIQEPLGIQVPLNVEQSWAHVVMDCFICAHEVMSGAILHPSTQQATVDDRMIVCSELWNCCCNIYAPLHTCIWIMFRFSHTCNVFSTSRRRTLAVLGCSSSLCQCPCAFAVQSSTMYSWYALLKKLENRRLWVFVEDAEHAILKFTVDAERISKWIAGMSEPIARQALRNTSLTFRCRDPLRYSVATLRDLTASDRVKNALIFLHAF